MKSVVHQFSQIVGGCLPTFHILFFSLLKVATTKSLTDSVQLGTRIAALVTAGAIRFHTAPHRTIHTN